MAEFRTDPLRGHTVLINGQRGNRPSEFTLRVETPDATHCAFCRGHEDQTPPSIEQDRSPDWNWRLFPNRFPAVLEDAQPLVENEYTSAAVGKHEVIIETADHNAEAADYSAAKWADIFKLWQRRLRAHYASPGIRYVHIFRNQGYRGGATLVHPHQQIVALPLVPDAIARRLALAENRNCIHCDWLTRERLDGARLLAATDRLVSVTAFAPRFPFEWQIISSLHARFEDESERTLAELSEQLQKGLIALRETCKRPDFNLILFTPPPAQKRGYWSLDILPRNSTQAGFEWGTGVHIVSTPPEEAAKKLRFYWG